MLHVLDVRVAKCCPIVLERYLIYKATLSRYILPCSSEKHINLFLVVLRFYQMIVVVL